MCQSPVQQQQLFKHDLLPFCKLIQQQLLLITHNQQALSITQAIEGLKQDGTAVAGNCSGLSMIYSQLRGCVLVKQVVGCEQIISATTDVAQGNL